MKTIEQIIKDKQNVETHIEAILNEFISTNKEVKSIDIDIDFVVNFDETLNNSLVNIQIRL